MKLEIQKYLIFLMELFDFWFKNLNGRGPVGPFLTIIFMLLDYSFVVSNEYMDV